MPECPKCDYDLVAGEYHRRYSRSDYGGVEKMLVELARDASRVLEVGCGTGHWLERLTEHGLDVTGLDASCGMLAEARRRVPDDILVEGTAERLPFEDSRFDVVYCINAFHHFRGKKEFIDEARRVLRLGGRLMTVGCDPHVGDDRWFVWDYFERALERDRVRYPPAGQIRDWLTDAGFDEVQTKVAIHFTREQTLQAATEAGRLERAASSQLALLSDDEYERGLARIRDDAAKASARGEELRLRTNIKLYATLGRAA